MTPSEPQQYFEDVAVGETVESGSYEVTGDEIVGFAERYDPQPFHVDAAAARESPFEGLVASGWHTAAVCQRLVVDGFLATAASAGGRGVDALRWHAPVRPGDELSVRAEVVDKQPPDDRTGPGHVRAAVSGYNQRDERVVSWTLLGMLARRRG